MDTMTDEVETEESLILKLRETEANLTQVKDAISPIREQRDTTRNSVKSLTNEETEKASILTAGFYAERQALDDAHRKEVVSLREEYEARKQELNELHSKLNTEAYDYEIEMRRLERTRDSIQRQLDQIRRARIKAADFANLNESWDRATMGAPWREWAKDHQLDAAKKIAYSGRMILADTMGLGKTLSAIIALDMIKSRTAGASPDEPIVID